MPYLDRINIVDFSTAYHYFTLGYVISAGTTGLDWQLYMRPFTKPLWAACAALVVVTYLTYVVTRRNWNKGHKFDAMRIVVFWGCLSFVFIKVYYEGALTMFFTTTNKIEPKTIDVLKLIFFIHYCSSANIN